MNSRRLRARVVAVLVVAVGVVAGDLALLPASVEAREAREQAAGPELSLVPGQPGDPSELAGLGSAVQPGAEVETAVGNPAGWPDPGAERPSGWVSPLAEGFVEGESVEVEELTSAQRRVFENPDGTMTEELSVEPVRFRDGGEWVDLDLELVDARGEAGFEPVAAPEGFAVAATADAEAVVTAPTDAGVVGLAQPGAAAVEGDLERSAIGAVASAGVADQVRFVDAVEGDSDLVVRVLPTGFESSVVVPDGESGRASFEQVLVVPDGVTARDGGAGVELVDAEGVVVGSYGSGVAFDSAQHPAEAEVVTSLVGQEGPAVTVAVSVDPVWLADAARVFPVTIDPVFSQSTSASGALDTYVQSNITSTPQNNSTELKIGRAYGTSYVRRALLKWNLSSIIGGNRSVVSAELSLAVTYSPSCTGRALSVSPLAAAFNASTLWSNQPARDAQTVNTAAFAAGYNSSCPAQIATVDVAPIVSRWVSGEIPNHGIRLWANESDDLAGKTVASAETFLPPTLTVTYSRPVSVDGQPSSPSDGVFVQEPPVLTTSAGTDPDGDALRYWWVVSTEPNAEGDVVASSGWQAPNQLSWTPPANVLVPGQTYHWAVATWDGYTWPNGFSASRSFTYDLRVGRSDLWPFDEAGPAAVNLTNGNLVVAASSPSMPALGGDMG